jgi:hypothetical protein
MRKIVIALAGMILITLLLTQEVICQSYLYGEWTAYCVIENRGKRSVDFCSICPVEISEDGRYLSVKTFEIIVDDTFIDLIIDSLSQKVQYQYNNDKKELEFTYQEEKQKFKILQVKGMEQTILMRDSKGMLLFLEKKE